MVWSNQPRTIKYPTDVDIAKGEAHWVKMEQRANKRFAEAETASARSRQAENALFARSAQYEARARGIV